MLIDFDEFTKAFYLCVYHYHKFQTSAAKKNLDTLTEATIKENELLKMSTQEMVADLTERMDEVALVYDERKEHIKFFIAVINHISKLSQNKCNSELTEACLKHKWDKAAVELTTIYANLHELLQTYKANKLKITFGDQEFILTGLCQNQSKMAGIVYNPEPTRFGKYVITHIFQPIQHSASCGFTIKSSSYARIIRQLCTNCCQNELRDLQIDDLQNKVLKLTAKTAITAGEVDKIKQNNEELKNKHLILQEAIKELKIQNVHTSQMLMFRGFRPGLLKSISSMPQHANLINDGARADISNSDKSPNDGRLAPS